MTRTKLHYCLTKSRTSPALLVFASAFLAAACSPEYPLGDLSHDALPVDGGPKVAAARVPDHTISPLLGAPDITMTLEATGGAITNVGDLDGDGFPEIAMVEYDAASDLSYVHLRYGSRVSRTSSTRSPGVKAERFWFSTGQRGGASSALPCRAR